ncbi:hypothetical protein ACVJBD_003660 [Rhizobium mongolense]
MKVDLLIAEFQRLAAFCECFHGHAEGSAVKLARRLDIGDGQDKVIEVADADQNFLLERLRAAQAAAKARASMPSVKKTTAVQPSMAKNQPPAEPMTLEPT